MASSEESEFESESGSGSRSPSLLETAGRKPSSSWNSSSKSGRKDGTSTVLPVVTPPATSQPSIARASEDEEESSSESESEHEPEDGTGTLQSVTAPASSQLSSTRERKGGDAGNGAGPLLVLHIGDDMVKFKRIWSESAEIALLKSLIKFRDEKSLDPLAHMDAFSDFIDKNSVTLEFICNESQLSNKIRKMKRKFVKWTVSGRIGEEPHDRKVFELSRVLWGRAGVPISPKKGRHAAAPSKLAEEELDWASVSLLLQLNGMGIDEEVLRVGMRMIDRSKVKETKERLREFRMAELEMSVERVALTNDLAKLFMAGYRAARK